MARLAKGNPSMGLMVEQVVHVHAHRFAPSKRPALRLENIRSAGRMGIPFTTGLLLGIGETQKDRVAGLQAIAELANEFQHIQEVILQPFSPGKLSLDFEGDKFHLQHLPAFVELARRILPSEVKIQVPPNLHHLQLVKENSLRLKRGQRDQ